MILLKNIPYRLIIHISTIHSHLYSSTPPYHHYILFLISNNIVKIQMLCNFIKKEESIENNTWWHTDIGNIKYINKIRNQDRIQMASHPYLFLYSIFIVCLYWRFREFREFGGVDLLWLLYWDGVMIKVRDFKGRLFLFLVVFILGFIY